MASLASASPGPAVLAPCLARRVAIPIADSGCETVTHAGASRPDGAGATPRSATGPRFPVRFVLAGRVRAVLLYLINLGMGSAAVTRGIGQARFKRVFTLVSRPTFDNCLDVSR
jgi:hypothetical protein